jgi:hypothetical protein
MFREGREKQFMEGPLWWIKLEWRKLIIKNLKRKWKMRLRVITKSNWQFNIGRFEIGWVEIKSSLIKRSGWWKLILNALSRWRRGGLGLFEKWTCEREVET